MSPNLTLNCENNLALKFKVVPEFDQLLQLQRTRYVDFFKTSKIHNRGKNIRIFHKCSSKI